MNAEKGQPTPRDVSPFLDRDCTIGLSVLVFIAAYLMGYYWIGRKHRDN